MSKRSNRLPMLAAEIKRAHNKARTAASTCLECAIEAGKLLIEAKANVPHGRWLDWLRDNCDMQERTAQHYTRLAKHEDVIDIKSATVADLTVRSAVAEITKSRPSLREPAEWDDIFEWAEQQAQAPLNAWDFDVGSWHSQQSKFMHHAGVPAEVAMFLSMANQYQVPTLRLCLNEWLIDALKIMALYAKQEKWIPIDTTGLNAHAATIAHIIIARQIVVHLWTEIEYREKHTNWPDEWDGIRDKLNRKFDAVQKWLDAGHAEYERTGEFPECCREGDSA